MVRPATWTTTSPAISTSAVRAARLRGHSRILNAVPLNAVSSYCHAHRQR